MQLPPWAPTLRHNQLTAIRTILDLFDTNDLVFLDAPTGSGKTLIAELIRQELNARALYLCSSIQLQHQFARDFPDAAILYGRSNYPTLDRPGTPTLSCADCNKGPATTAACQSCTPTPTNTRLHCLWCHPVPNCPYERAKRQAIISDLTCTNSTYFLYEANYIGLLPTNRQLIIIDEADTLETTLLNFISVTISDRRAKELGIDQPERKTVESAWVEWAISTEEVLRRHLASAQYQHTTVESVRRRIRLERLYSDTKRLNDKETGLSSGGWVYTGYDRGEISFKPVEVNQLSDNYLWKHGRDKTTNQRAKWLLMSATMISFEAMAECLGVGDYAVV